VGEPDSESYLNSKFHLILILILDAMVGDLTEKKRCSLAVGHHEIINMIMLPIPDYCDDGKKA
jgi:hypothetical protein